MKRFVWAFAMVLLTSVACGDDTGEDVFGPPCGAIDCNAGEYCCDTSCSLCIDEATVCPDACP